MSMPISATHFQMLLSAGVIITNSGDSHFSCVVLWRCFTQGMDQRSYISRVENGHTLPVLETLEKIARALPLVPFCGINDGG